MCVTLGKYGRLTGFMGLLSTGDLLAVPPKGACIAYLGPVAYNTYSYI